jgi:cytochrome P450
VPDLDRGARNLTTVSGMAADTQDAADPALDWFTAQPYEAWAEVRRSECPVLGISSDVMGPGTFFQITKFNDADAALRDDKTFASSINMEHIGEFMGELLVGMDGEEHRKYRNLVAKAFRASQLDQWDKALVRPIINRLLDDVAPAGRAELVGSVTSLYPMQVICGIVGVPLTDAAQFAQWAEEINTGPMMPERGHAASAAMKAYLEPLVEARRAEPTGDFLSDLVNAEIDGEGLTDGKLYGFLRLLLPAGGETTFRVMGNALYALLTHPDALARVYADRDLIPEVIEETLRWETSVTMVSRVAAADTEVAGCPIAKGSPVGVLTGSSNRDEDRWDDGAEWKLGRPVQHHLAFGTGPHQCLGMHLARLELRVGLNEILERLANLRLDPERADQAVIEGFAFRGPRALPVTFDPS